MGEKWFVVTNYRHIVRNLIPTCHIGWGSTINNSPLFLIIIKKKKKRNIYRNTYQFLTKSILYFIIINIHK